MKWILGTERLPEIGKSVYCRKSYYADKSGTGKTVFTIGKKNSKGELSVIERYPANWEWLDEEDNSLENTFEQLLVEQFALSELRDFWRNKAGMPLKCIGEFENNLSDVKFYGARSVMPPPTTQGGY